MDLANGEVNIEFALRKLESKYFYWFLVAFIFLNGINVQTVAIIIAIVALKFLKWLFKDEYDSLILFYLPYFEIVTLYLFTFILIPNFFWFSIVTLPLLVLRSNSHELYNTTTLHLYIGIIAFLIQGITSLILYSLIISLVPIYPLSLVVLTFLSFIPAMLYYFATIFKIKKQYFYEDYNLFIYVAFYVIIMTIITTLPLYL